MGNILKGVNINIIICLKRRSSCLDEPHESGLLEFACNILNSKRYFVVCMFGAIIACYHSFVLEAFYAVANRFGSCFCFLVAARAASAATYKFCYENWAPYAEKVDEKNAKGSTADFVTEVMKSLGHTVEFVSIGSPDRCIAEVESGRLTGMLFNSAGGVKGGLESIPTEYWLIAAIVNSKNPMTKFTSMDDFKGKTAGVVKGYTYPDVVVAALKTMKHDIVPDAAPNLRKLSAGRIDVSFDDPVWVDEELKREKFEIKSLFPLIASDPTFVTFGPGQKDIFAAYNAKAKELEKSGALEKAYEKNMGMSLKAFKVKYKIK